MQIKDSVALITGAASGIGEATAKHLASLGAKIALIDRDLGQIERVRTDIETAGGAAISVAGDVTSEEDSARFVEATLQAFGKLNIAVSCAGVIRDGTLLNIDKNTGQVSRTLGFDKWKTVIDVNLTGTFLTLRDCAQAMVNGGWDGLLVPISSVNKIGQVGQLNYSATKAAIERFPKIIVGEFLLRKIRNVRCVGIAPGYTETRILQDMNQDALQAILKDVHLGRLIKPTEIADMIAYCAQNEALNATTIEITGGLCFPGNIAK
ncbi:SDR family NAD(P)-dependent oxidoreductase [Orrella daihaiensis]|uniref:SDR family NAD(P)-dependent oxidoreductase n=1 Tax=Orrella daihaiensis TaxID=2782176 RepID=A0ABY4AHM6_9BURK|nr:SDR family NAD(P)-dependent oxidoreductase [Orrella daihaiensis]UOD49413.1 SDR family NAD(P)-dependent oxidoreductase [Orrella daihaiensis]